MNKKDYIKDKQLFAKAIAEGISAKFDEMVETSGMTANCSEEYHSKIKEILYRESECQKKKLSKIKLIAALVAAAILLTGCTLCVVFRREIADFIECVYENYIKVNDGDDDNNAEAITIDKVYSLSYVPEGFELSSETITPSMIKYEWINSDKQILKFVQTPICSYFFADINNAYNSILSYNDTQIYYRAADHTHTYIWSNEKYDFNLVAPFELSEEELLKIVNGIIVKE